MSTFTVGLGVLGGVVLAGVVGWNAWTTRRLTPRQAEAAPRVEPAADREPVEPTLESGFTMSPGSADSDVPPLPMPEKKPGLDALIDALAPIAVEGPVSGEAALAALPATRRAGSKPFGIEGLDAASGQWETPQAGHRYTAFQAGVQLANRVGPLNEIEFSEFVIKAQAFADAVNGSPEFPEMLHEVSRARELDQFAGGHDAQLGFTLRARHAAWSPGYVQQNAARLGFVAGAIPGRMVLPAMQPGNPPILVLTFDTQAALAEDPTQAAIREVSLSLDVPQVHRTEQPFLRMCEAAIALAEGMDGVVTDDNGQVIQPEGMDVIGADLEKLYDMLESRDLAAGSQLARRVFS
ncbi:cell division protein ZipA C-terminal FtsZ-binding domain-containing protein [Ramlibacter sp. MMS24-I3-19]|uniref:cell division protein ZipA C-terminal FtsZ-binding domain-containing protein n=1 Tax=Ramlibacter sp. MMS24-I3-19 TaxID=3416606 RepID=UPI003CFDEF42